MRRRKRKEGLGKRDLGKAGCLKKCVGEGIPGVRKEGEADMVGGDMGKLVLAFWISLSMPLPSHPLASIRAEQNPGFSTLGDRATRCLAVPRQFVLASTGMRPSCTRQNDMTRHDRVYESFKKLKPARIRVMLREINDALPAEQTNATV